MVKFSTALAAIALASQVTEVDATKCYVLALSAGEETSAYQAGAFKGLTESNPSATQYDVITGVNGGAVNASIIASYAKGKESSAASRMKTFWDNAANSTLYKDWRGGLAQGYAFEGGLYNSSPMETFLGNELSDITKMNRNLNIGITNELSGKMNNFTQDNILFSDNLTESMYASLSVPGFFAPVDAFGSDYYNGSSIVNLDIFSGINKCLERHTESDIVVDVILTSTSHLKTIDPSQNTTIYNFARYLQVSGYYSSMNAYLKAIASYPSATFRYFVHPLSHFPRTAHPLDLTQEQVDSIYSMGEADAKNVAVNGNHINLIVDYFTLKTANKAEVRGVSLDEYLADKLQAEVEIIQE